MKSIIVFIFSFILVSCSTNQTSISNDSDSNVVDLDRGTSEKRSPKINNEHVGVGPSLPSSENIKSGTKAKRSVWGLILSPGLNRVICHAVAVRAMYEKGITFNVYTGSGMGAVVAAFLAEKITPEVIEWKFHKFFQKSKSLKPFSNEWIELVKSDLLIGFKGKQIQSTKLTLVLPAYNNEERRIEYARRGDLHAKLLENLKLSKGKNGKFSTPLERGALGSEEFRKFGVQKVVNINVLGKKIAFSKNEDYLFGLFGKLSTNYMDIAEREFDYQLNLPLENFSLDTIENLPEYLRTSYLYLRDNSSELKEDYLNESKN